MKYARRIPLLTIAGALALLVPLATATPASANVTATEHFVVVDDPFTSGDSAYLNNGATNGQKGDILFLADSFTPGSVCGCATLTKPLGVWYDATKRQWAVFNEDFSTMVIDPSFNILVVPKSSKSVFIHVASHSNTSGNHTFLSSSLLNGKPSAIIQITQDYNPGGTLAGTSNPHPVGVRYYRSVKKWAIFNEDGAGLPMGAAFNVLIGAAASNGGKTAVTTDTSNKTLPGFVLFSNPASNGDPNNVTFVTQNFDPNGKGGTANPHPLLVAYGGAYKITLSREAVGNADFSVPPLHSSFNLLIFAS